MASCSSDTAPPAAVNQHNSYKFIRTLFRDSKFVHMECRLCSALRCVALRCCAVRCGSASCGIYDKNDATCRTFPSPQRNAAHPVWTKRYSFAPPPTALNAPLQLPLHQRRLRGRPRASCLRGFIIGPFSLEERGRIIEIATFLATKDEEKEDVFHIYCQMRSVKTMTTVTNLN